MQKDETNISFVMRFSFYTVRQFEHTGGNFDTKQIIEDVRKAIARYPIELVNHFIKPIYDDDKTKIARYKMCLDFRIRITSKQMDYFKDRNRGFLNAFGKNEPEQYFMKKYISLINEILEEIDGIDYVPTSCNPYEVIYCEGRVDTISK